MSYPLAKDGCPNAHANAERSCPAGTYCASFHKCEREAQTAFRRGAERIFAGSGRHYAPDLSNVDLGDGGIHRIT